MQADGSPARPGPNTFQELGDFEDSTWKHVGITRYLIRLVMERTGLVDQYLREIRLRPDPLGHQLEGPDVLPFGLVGGQDMPLQILNRVERLIRSEEHTSELQSIMRISYDVFC